MTERLIEASMVPSQVAINTGRLDTFSPQLDHLLSENSQLVIGVTSINYTSGTANTTGNITNAAGLSIQGTNNSIFTGGSTDGTVLNSVTSAKTFNVTGVTNATDVVRSSSKSEGLASARGIGQQFTETWTGNVGVNFHPLTAAGSLAIDNSILGGTVGRTDFSADLASLSLSGLNSTPIIMGTDYASLTNRLADLSSHGDVVTGWTLTYAPHASH